MTVPYYDFSAMTPVTAPRRGYYESIGKRLIDLFAVLVAAPVVLPLVAVILIATWFQGGKPLYVQYRIGRGGKVFK